MIFQIVLMALVVSKNFETIRTTGTIGSFHMIVSIGSPQGQEARGRQRCLWVRQKNFSACFANKRDKMMINTFIRRANLVPCYRLFLSILRIRRREHDVTDFL